MTYIINQSWLEILRVIWYNSLSTNIVRHAFINNRPIRTNHSTTKNRPLLSGDAWYLWLEFINDCETIYQTLVYLKMSTLWIQWIPQPNPILVYSLPLRQKGRPSSFTISTFNKGNPRVAWDGGLHLWAGRGSHTGWLCNKHL